MRVVYLGVPYISYNKYPLFLYLANTGCFV